MHGRKTRESFETSGFLLEKTMSNFRDVPIYHAVLRFLKHLCHRPAIRFGLARDPRGRLRDSRFASFLAENNRRPYATDLQDAVLRGRKAFRFVLVGLLAGGGAWILVESARALSTF